MRVPGLALILLLVPIISGCPGLAANERNPFLTATESYGASLFGADDETGAAAGAVAETAFRQRMAVTLANHDTSADLNVRFAAWVNVSSIRSAEQQDELVEDGYVQLDQEVRVGSAFTLPPGTFVYGGPGAAGATLLRLPASVLADEGSSEVALLSTWQLNLVTPDVILLFMEPPVSCDSVAFTFTEQDVSVDESLNVAATQTGGRKTLAQFDAYQCSPLRPGLFFSNGGGARESNEYFEGTNIQVDFSRVPNAAGYAALVTMEATAAP